MKNERRKIVERFAAFLTLLLATALMTYAATSTAATPAAARPARAAAAAVAPRATAAAAPELLVTIDSKTAKSPVKRDARAADEPLSRRVVSAAPAARKLSNSDPDAPRYRTIRMEVTAYCACRECCGPNARGITASGQPVSYNKGKFVAADTSLLPFGTKLIIPGYNKSRPVPVADRGGAIEGRRLDLFFPSHQQALQWGRQMVDVTVLDG